MPQTEPISLELTPELQAKIDEFEARLAPVLEDAAALAQAADELLAFIPAQASPVVLVRDRLAPLQAALDSMREHVEALNAA